MFERFTDRARRVVVLAQEEARLLKHNFIGTEHLLLGLIREGDGVAAEALESVGIGLDAVRRQVALIVGEGAAGSAQSGHIPFTPRAKKVLELALRQALQLGHNYIGTEHILLGVLAEGHGVAVRVITEADVEPARLRSLVIGLLPDAPAVEEAVRGGRRGVMAGSRGRAQYAHLRARLKEIEERLAAIEGRAGTGPDDTGLDRQIAKVRENKDAAVKEQEYERAAQLRDTERQLLADKEARRAAWAAAHPDLPTLAALFNDLGKEVGRLRELLRQHGIDSAGPRESAGEHGESSADARGDSGADAGAGG